MTRHRLEAERRGNALDDLLLRARRRVRVLEGPLLGSSYELWSGIRIGRLATSDILVLLPEISRQHAQLVEDMHGDHWLVDLGSSNGTWIGAQRIGRQLLMPGTVFRVGDVRFIYEDQSPMPPADATSQVQAVSYQHAHGRRSTRELCYDGGWSLQAARREVEDPHRASRLQEVTAVGDDGEPYEGCLVDDLVEYRGLRLRMIRYGLDTTTLLDRFEQLEDRLWGRRSERGRESSTRRPLGFACRLPAALRLADGSSLVTSVRWLGVSGAELVASRLPVELGEVVWLTFELVVTGRPRTVVMTCRVSWVDGNRARLRLTGLSDELEAMPQTLEPTHAGPQPKEVPTQELSAQASAMPSAMNG